MRYIGFLGAMLAIFSAHAADNIGVADLNSVINNVRNACIGIADEISDLKKMAGINTAVTAIGTGAAGVALGAGIAKSKIDAELKAKLLKLAVNESSDSRPITYEEVAAAFANAPSNENKTNSNADDEALKKSKTLGNIRTGGLATSTAANIAGVVIAKNNKVDNDLKSKIDRCTASVKVLSVARMQARIDGSATDADLARAEKIVSACSEYDTIDVSPINKRSTGVMISSGLGAGLGLAGTITSAQANKGIELDNKKNTMANVLAGGTTAASAVATVFNATQISAIKRVATVADNCMEALQ
ncbi:MAG: hypothetical protein IKL14_00890 [Alphaproteobacteria bacterium]|nr:hypothetical protein [Alphaproteobacteria bacterium]